MPNESINIYLSAKDGVSGAFSAIADKAKALDKETRQLQQTTASYTKATGEFLRQQARLEAELKDAAAAVNTARKACNEYGDEMMKLGLEQAIENQARLRGELFEVNEQIAQNKKAWQASYRLRRAFFKSSSRAVPARGRRPRLFHILEMSGRTGRLFILRQRRAGGYNGLINDRGVIPCD